MVWFSGCNCKKFLIFKFFVFLFLFIFLLVYGQLTICSIHYCMENNNENVQQNFNNNDPTMNPLLHMLLVNNHNLDFFHQMNNIMDAQVQENLNAPILEDSSTDSDSDPDQDSSNSGESSSSSDISSEQESSENNEEDEVSDEVMEKTPTNTSSNLSSAQLSQLSVDLSSLSVVIPSLENPSPDFSIIPVNSSPISEIVSPEMEMTMEVNKEQSFSDFLKNTENQK